MAVLSLSAGGAWLTGVRPALLAGPQERLSWFFITFTCGGELRICFRTAGYGRLFIDDDEWVQIALPDEGQYKQLRSALEKNSVALHG